PTLLFAWPTSRTAVMGSEQLVGVLSILRDRALQAGKEFDEERHNQTLKDLQQQIDSESRAIFMSGRIYDDGIIDPRDTRTVVALALAACPRFDEDPDRVYGSFRM